MSEIKIKQGDTGRLWTDTLTLDGSPVNLTGATVELLLKRKGSSGVFVRAATVGSPATDGEVSYQPVAEDVAEVGLFLAEWRVTFAGGGVLSVPSDGYIQIRVLHDLEPD